MDHSVIQDSFDNPESAIKSSAIIAQAHSQNLSVIAKGVETHEQLAFAAAQGCDLIQGFCISRAMPAFGLAEFLRERTSIPIRY
jgi:EAL domain-containing protein (putative c-di-GMP-specific phosphodiesterase class I)